MIKDNEALEIGSLFKYIESKNFTFYFMKSREELLRIGHDPVDGESLDALGYTFTVIDSFHVTQKERVDMLEYQRDLVQLQMQGFEEKGYIFILLEELLRHKEEGKLLFLEEGKGYNRGHGYGNSPFEFL